MLDNNVSPSGSKFVRTLKGRGVLATCGVAITALCGALLVAPASASSNGSAGQRKSTTVTIGNSPGSFDAILFAGIKDGYYSRRGLDVRIDDALSAPAIAASVESGQDQFGFDTIMGVIEADAHGGKFKCVTPIKGGQAKDGLKDPTELVVRNASGIKNAAGLAGKTIGVVALGTKNAVEVQYIAKLAGIDYKSVHLVAIPFPQMASALHKGIIDGAVTTQPFLTADLRAGAHDLVPPDARIFGGGNVDCWATTDAYIAAHASVVHAFYEATAQSIIHARGHLKATLDTLVQHGLAPNDKVAQREVLPSLWHPSINLPSVRKAENMLVEFGYITKASAPPLSAIVYKP